MTLMHMGGGGIRTVRLGEAETARLVEAEADVRSGKQKGLQTSDIQSDQSPPHFAIWGNTHAVLTLEYFPSVALPTFTGERKTYKHK